MMRMIGSYKSFGVSCAINRCEYVDDKDANPHAMFSLYVGIIAPLYLVANRCQILEVRNEAIALLSERPWREGAWDSSVIAASGY